MNQAYRRDIDGLRALAVLSITLFHFDFAMFSGGFVGVDVFFVISGFLITRGIHAEIGQHRFSTLAFYERRIRRIFPALLAMLLMVSVVEAAIAFPDELRDYVPTLLGALLFSSNIVLYSQLNYFAPAADFKPLLHTWSLGIEEQFYIVLPWFILLLVRWAPRRVNTGLAVAMVASFALSLVATRYAASASFYLLPTRAWELLAGSLVGLGAMPRLNTRKMVEGAGLLGVATIIGSIVLIRSDMPFPGPTAAFPVIGAALVLAYGDRARWIMPILANPVARFFGLISYSLYLWHWPVAVFLRLYGLLGTEPSVRWWGLAGSIVLGWASWRYIERPFRNRQRFDERAVFRLAGAGALVICVIGGGLAATHGWPSRFTADQRAVLAAHDDISPSREPCHIQQGDPDPASACVLGQGEPHAALWGDSHGVEMALALSERAGALRSITYSSCSPAPGWTSLTQPLCRAHNDRVMRYLAAAPAIRTVYLAAYYSTSIDNPAFRAGMRRAVAGLLQAGKHVVVIGPTPAEGTADVPAIMVRTGLTRIPRSRYETSQAPVIAFLAQLRSMGATVWMPADVMCDPATCMLATAGHPVLFDRQHLSMAGARFLALHLAGGPSAR